MFHLSPVFSSLALVYALILVFDPSNARAQDAADPLELQPPVVRQSKRLRIRVSAHPQRGLLVQAIDLRGPVSRMVSVDNPSLVATMEVGDTIQAVDGQPVNTPEDVLRILDHAGERVQLSLVDRNSGQVADWLVTPDTMNQTAARAASGYRPNGMVFAVLIADTSADKLGSFAEFSLGELRRKLEVYIPGDRLMISVLSRDKCNAHDIIKRIATLPTSDQDTLLVYYLGHGAYDERFAADDSAGGHFCALPGKDLLRQTLWRYMEDAPARLRIMISDSCNDQSTADPDQEYTVESRVKAIRIVGPSLLERLLFEYRGQLDINAAAQDELAWYSPTGGWFTESLLQMIDEQALTDWDAFLDRLQTYTQSVFEQRKASLTADSAGIDTETLAKLQEQESMTPTAFRRDVTKVSVPVAVAQNRIRVIEIEEKVGVPAN